jgi:hypothetical protein
MLILPMVERCAEVSGQCISLFEWLQSALNLEDTDVPLSSPSVVAQMVNYLLLRICYFCRYTLGRLLIMILRAMFADFVIKVTVAVCIRPLKSDI